MVDGSESRSQRSPWFWSRIALALLPVSVGVWLLAVTLRNEPLQLALLATFALLTLAQVALCLCTAVAGVRRHRRTGQGGIAAACVGTLAAAAATGTGLFGSFLGIFAAGGGWGRPLRVRGRQLHPELRAGADWTAGARPAAEGLDAPTRTALEALWLHDAQKEHASVPAFARLSWLLATAGAPAELLQWSQRAALEEIDHAQRCFALAAGYGGRTHTVLPMPELLVAPLGVQGNVLVVLATESLADGCLLEDFNADIAAECAAVCEEPVTRAVLQQIAREERSHAEFSWAVVDWALRTAADTVATALEDAVGKLGGYRRPTAVSWRKQALVDRADAVQLRRHGRLPDARWREVWDARTAATIARAHERLAVVAAAAT